jgi:hypothetical protein
LFVLETMRALLEQTAVASRSRRWQMLPNCMRTLAQRSLARAAGSDRSREEVSRRNRVARWRDVGVHDLSVAIDGSIDRVPATTDASVRLIHSPVGPDRLTVLSSCLAEQGRACTCSRFQPITERCCTYCRPGRDQTGSKSGRGGLTWKRKRRFRATGRGTYSRIGDNLPPLNYASFIRERTLVPPTLVKLPLRRSGRRSQGGRTT